MFSRSDQETGYRLGLTTGIVSTSERRNYRMRFQRKGPTMEIDNADVGELGQYDDQSVVFWTSKNRAGRSRAWHLWRRG